MNLSYVDFCRAVKNPLVWYLIDKLKGECIEVYVKTDEKLTLEGLEGSKYSFWLAA